MNQIRKATTGEAETLEKVFSYLYKPEKKWSVEKIRTNMENGKREYYLMTNPEVLGALEVKENEVVALSIIHKGRGYGKELIIFAENLIKQKGYETMFLWTLDVYNTRGFHEKNGFMLEETRPNLVDNQTGYKYIKRFK